MGERGALTEQVARRYRRAGKKEKAVMLGEFVQTTGYTRKYAIHLLNSWGRTRLVQIDGRMVKLVVGHPRRAKRRARPRRYDQEVLKALKQIWYVFDFMCAKRLVVVLRTMLPVLDSFGEIPLTAEVRAKLLSISAATIDRVLQRERARLSLKGRSHTKPQAAQAPDPDPHLRRLEREGAGVLRDRPGGPGRRRRLGRRAECSRGFVALWPRRFRADRLAGLYSRHRGQKPFRCTPSVEAKILNATRKPPTDGSTHWSTRRLAATLGVSHMMVARVWNKHRLRPTSSGCT